MLYRLSRINRQAWVGPSSTGEPFQHVAAQLELDPPLRLPRLPGPTRLGQLRRDGQGDRKQNGLLLGFPRASDAPRRLGRLAGGAGGGTECRPDRNARTRPGFTCARFAQILHQPSGHDLGQEQAPTKTLRPSARRLRWRLTNRRPAPRTQALRSRAVVVLGRRFNSTRQHLRLGARRVTDRVRPTAQLGPLESETSPSVHSHHMQLCYNLCPPKK
ncbi:unnamed protein product [Protopolystoma xenopodis]|uniref:Uncharacterized protein n=1 Tax=Protopolystoma xenopodis TaxID=117903 RepID=A0A448XCX7_9PLAT|nr:unnamed protein product [Protopolystoma xenopodis]